jgi:hypothetical protein
MESAEGREVNVEFQIGATHGLSPPRHDRPVSLVLSIQPVFETHLCS